MAREQASLSTTRHGPHTELDFLSSLLPWSVRRAKAQDGDPEPSLKAEPRGPLSVLAFAGERRGSPAWASSIPCQETACL